MGISDIEQDLKIIRQAIEASSRYTNITARGYFFTGVVGIIGTWRTFMILGREKVADMTLITSEDLATLTILWGLVFVAAIGVVMFFSWRKARKNKISAWNSLAARMFLSQVPLIVVAGIFSIAMAVKGYYSFIPGLWLGLYGVIIYSFSYFTGFSHKIEGLLFILLGSVAVFTSGVLPLLLLGLGFGGIHTVSGLIRWSVKGKVQHESDPVE